MTMQACVLACGLMLVFASACNAGLASFGDDLAFMKKHTEIIVLSDEDGQSQVAVAPAYQGRVMTSTATGEKGMSFGWINRELIASGETRKHINPWGGEDRFWMGPEGGQYAIFFEAGTPYDLEHWQTPPVIDTVTFKPSHVTKDTAVFMHRASFRNRAGFEFHVEIDRKVRLLSRGKAAAALGVSVPSSVKMVAFESDNRLTNCGRKAWKTDTGLLSIWILGMFSPSDKLTVVIPYKEGPESKLGPVVNDAYFGKVPAERLSAKDGVVYFSGDGKYRSKIGLTPQRAKPVLGSYDAVNQVLTIVQYTKPAGATEYVNSMWEDQKEPYAGDVVNSYNDGPPAPGKKPLGPFYELETSSPAAALEPGKSISHVHRTFHIVGPTRALDEVAKATLGVGLDKINAALK